MSQYTWEIEVRTTGHLDYWIKDHFDGLDLKHNNDGSSLIYGELPDMPALYGMFNKLRDIGVIILSMEVWRKEIDNVIKIRK